MLARRLCETAESRDPTPEPLRDAVSVLLPGSSRATPRTRHACLHTPRATTAEAAVDGTRSVQAQMCLGCISAVSAWSAASPSRLPRQATECSTLRDGIRLHRLCAPREGGVVTYHGERLLIHELINLRGHLVDEGNFDRLAELFTEDVVYDVTALGGGRLLGPAAVAEAARAMGEKNPLSHHVTNVVVTRLTGDRATAVSKGLAVLSDGGTGSVLYRDELIRTRQGWRIAIRTVLPRTRPLTCSGRRTAAE
jgi:hypothetical protein